MDVHVRRAQRFARHLQSPAKVTSSEFSRQASQCGLVRLWADLEIHPTITWTDLEIHPTWQTDLEIHPTWSVCKQRVN